MTEGIATSHSIEKKKIKKKNGNMSSNMCVHTYDYFKSPRGY